MSIFAKFYLEAKRKTSSGSFSFHHFITPFYSTSLPSVPEISSRFVPGNSPVEVMNEPVAPLA